MTQDVNTPDRLEIIPTGGALGAEIRGVDLAKPLPDDMFAAMRGVWHEHLVLLIRDQTLDDDQLVAFARRFGELHVADGYEYGGKPDGLPAEVELISNIVRNGRPIGALGAGEAVWHTDMSMFEIPASATLLYAELIPPKGGNTRFTNNVRACETLPPDLRRAVDGRHSIHDAAYLAGGGVRRGHEAVADKTQGPGARHPVIRTHPDTGRHSLYLGRIGNGYILDLPIEESDRLLDALWAHVTRPEFIWEHEWRAGDLLIWDNRCVSHARGSFDPGSRRLLHRVTVKSEKPCYTP